LRHRPPQTVWPLRNCWPNSARNSRPSRQVAARGAGETAAAEAPKPEPIVFTAYEGPVPVPASYKPAKPAQLIRASYTPDEGKTVTRKAPPALTASKADVRNLADASSLQTPEAFLAAGSSVHRLSR
jgi:hypothetical protein